MDVIKLYIKELIKIKKAEYLPSPILLEKYITNMVEEQQFRLHKPTSRMNFQYPSNFKCNFYSITYCVIAAAHIGPITDLVIGGRHENAP